MKVRSRWHEIDCGAILFIGLIIFFSVLIITLAIQENQRSEYEHIEKMEQIKCGEEEE